MPGNKIINGLWIGRCLSKIELLCIKSFLRHGHEFHLWVYDIIETPLPEELILEDAAQIISRSDVFNYHNKNQYGHGKGSYAGFSDIFRYKLLYEKGGWWVDMDVCCLKPFDFDAEYVFRTHHDFPMVGNIMKCPRGSRLMKMCYEEAITHVNAENTDWNKPINILNENIAGLGLEKYILNISNSDEWAVIRNYLRNNYNTPATWYAIHWINEEWRSRKINKNAINKKSVLGKQLADNGLYKRPFFVHLWINNYKLHEFKPLFRMKKPGMKYYHKVRAFVIHYFYYQFFGFLKFHFSKLYYGITGFVKFYAQKIFYGITGFVKFHSRKIIRKK